MRAYFLAANLESSSDLAPVQTIFPELKIRAVVLGSRILIMTAANRLGLYSALRAWSAIFFRSNLHPRLTVDTIFLKTDIHCYQQILSRYNVLIITVVEELFQVQQKLVSLELEWMDQRYQQEQVSQESVIVNHRLLHWSLGSQQGTWGLAVGK